MLYEITTVVLLAVICFLLYRLYRIKYTRSGEKPEFIPHKLKMDLEDLGADRDKETEMRFKDMGARISELEKKIQKNESVIEKLIEDLG
jgi:hypothetical protein